MSRLELTDAPHIRKTTATEENVRNDFPHKHHNYSIMHSHSGCLASPVRCPCPLLCDVNASPDFCIVFLPLISVLFFHFQSQSAFICFRCARKFIMQTDIGLSALSVKWNTFIKNGQSEWAEIWAVTWWRLKQFNIATAYRGAVRLSDVCRRIKILPSKFPCFDEQW